MPRPVVRSAGRRGTYSRRASGSRASARPALWHGVVSAVAPGMAGGQALQREPAAAGDAVTLDRPHGVFRAGWRVPAGCREHRTHGALVEAKGRQDQGLHRSDDRAAIVASAAAAASRSLACGADPTGGRATMIRSQPARCSRSRITVRNASRTRRRARFRATPRPMERGAETARRIVVNPFGRARTAKSECWSFIPSLHTAAISAFRRRRAASMNAAALDDGEALAATRAARGEHTTSACGTHARTKTVHARTTAGLRLISALHGRVPSPAGNKAITLIRGCLFV